MLVAIWQELPLTPRLLHVPELESLSCTATATTLEFQDTPTVSVLIMSSDRPHIPRRSFGVQDSALDDEETAQPGVVRRVFSRLSFGGSQHRPSFTSLWRSGDDNSGTPHTGLERPPIPTMIQPSGEVYTTPLPTLSMIVLSIVRIPDVYYAVWNNTAYRLCLANFSQRMSQRRFCYSWSKVCLLLLL